jgi:thymidylate synthase
MTNEQAIYPYYKSLYDKIVNKDFITDKSGVTVVELIAPRIVLNPSQKYLDFNGRKSPRKYIEKEDAWYNSHQLKINMVGDIAIWQQVSDDNDEINSNYGNLVYSRNNFSQFSNVLKTLSNHKESRQGIVIYTRPSIHYEWNSHSASDFICTNYQQFFIRNDMLHCVTSMRSNDLIFGLTNDLYWFHDVIQKMHEALSSMYPGLKLGDHIFIPNSLHAYERHFDKIRYVVENNKQYEG